MSELKRIKVSLNLRDPQRESLDIFSKICDTISMTKNPDLITPHALCGYVPDINVGDI